jgi:hypothetical protein
MSFFSQPSDVIKSAGLAARAAGSVGAGLLAVAALAQLFTFEEFPAVLAGYPLPGGYASAILLAALLATVEVLAVPYLVMMRLSPLMQGMSLACGWLSCIVWSVLGLVHITQAEISNSGLLGATIAISSGWPTVLFVIVVSLCLLVTMLPAVRNLTARR